MTRQRIAGSLAGIFVAAITVALVEWLGHKLFPLPGGVDVAEPAKVGEALRNAPAAPLLVVVAAWVLGAFLGGFTARRVSAQAAPSLVVAAFVLLGIVMNALQIPHPAWMLALGVAGVVLAGVVTSRLRLGARP